MYRGGMPRRNSRDAQDVRRGYMRDDQSQPKEEGKLSNKDITPVLKGWDYEPGTINVRKVAGADGSPKLQMRLDLGVLQMEMTGRPDAVRPHGRAWLLDCFERLPADL